MGSPSDFGLCTSRVVYEEDLCRRFPAKSIGDDAFKEDLLVCDDAEIRWSGDPRSCTKEFEGTLPAEKLSGFTGKSGTIAAPLTIVKRVGTSPALCGDTHTAEMERLGIATDQVGDDCFITPYGTGKRLLSYPVQAKVGLAIEDVRTEWTKRIIRFRIGEKEIGIGTAGSFVLKNGKTVKGIVVNFGFVPIAPTAARGKTAADLPPKNVNVYIYTIRSRDSGRLINLDEITGVTDLADREMRALAVQYREDHRSIQELLDDLQKNSPPGPDITP